MPLPQKQPSPKRSWLSLCARLLVWLGGLAMVAISAVAFFDSLHWSVRLLSPFRPQYLGLSVLLLIVGFLARSSWFARGLCGASIAMNLAVLWPWLLPVTDQTPSRPFLLMTWNTWTEHPDPARVAEAVSQSGADIALLCETPSAWREGPPPKIEGYTTRAYNQYVVAVREGGPLELESSRFLRPLWFAEGVVRYAGRPVRIAVGHTGRPTTLQGCRIQDYHHKHLVKWFSQAKTPAIVVGDFNQTPWCPSLARTIAALGLLDSSRGHGCRSTYPATPPVISRLIGVPIDHCFYTGELTCSRRWVGSANGSNHRPVFVEIGWRDDLSD